MIIFYNVISKRMFLLILHLLYVSVTTTAILWLQSEQYSWHENHFSFFYFSYNNNNTGNNIGCTFSWILVPQNYGDITD